MTKKECEKNCSNCKNDCSSCRQYQEKAFELEVDEEMEQERLNQMWQKYRGWIIGGVAAILLLTAGTQIYRSWWQQVRLEESDIYEQSVLLANNKKYDEAQKGLEQLAASAHTGYKALAQLQLADVFMQQNKTDEAFKIWKEMIDKTSSKDPFYHVAVLSYTGNQIGSADPKEMLTLLDKSLNHPQFQGLATEIAVQFLIQQKQPNLAKELIQKALKNPALSKENKARLNTLLLIVEE